MAATGNATNLDSVRDSLIRQEDTIVFCLIERARFPSNPRLYDPKLKLVPGFSGSLIEYILKESEAIQAKAGRFQNPEENPFFPNGLPTPVVPPYKYTTVLHYPAASVNLNNQVLDMYVNHLLPIFVTQGDDGNYASTAANDLNCLQALSKRIHLGKYVAESKYLESPKEYETAIRAKDRTTLMNMLTVKSVEEEVKKRVSKKAEVFGQNVSLNTNTTTTAKPKIDPSVLFRLYDQWVIPLTKSVEVEYLIRRLD